MERVVQGMIIGGIVLLIAGTLAWEWYIEPRYRRWRVRRRHQHAREILSEYRALRRKFLRAGGGDVWAILARPRARVAAGRLQVYPPMWGDSN
jgi:hypothetical protein